MICKYFEHKLIHPDDMKIGEVGVLIIGGSIAPHFIPEDIQRWDGWILRRKEKERYEKVNGNPTWDWFSNFSFCTSPRMRVRA